MVGPSRANMEEEQPSLEMPTCTAIVRQMAVSTQVHNTQMEGVLGPLHRKPHPSALIHADLPQPAHSPASVSTPHTAPRNNVSSHGDSQSRTAPDAPHRANMQLHAVACSSAPTSQSDREVTQDRVNRYQWKNAGSSTEATTESDGEAKLSMVEEQTDVASATLPTPASLAGRHTLMVV
eukprot:CAMPEP_0174316862 /NCGR_PEP_ID=MMETSP0810-20121108/7235_1 /TAXON_ID=73025 ORGANISM="Eutreptiella gymnastica-like, Strain CCMP1594" /NCGR_SAMPLE_ID=MMETSP0810 /ASSEMBLY_ACC=CAM_ASM_000659 /LENGTH=178 /DNA_ID=CAMNT_0015426721 /DNA_START=171 /DNA_END=706 /DNA_ORIENTATION=-